MSKSNIKVFYALRGASDKWSKLAQKMDENHNWKPSIFAVRIKNDKNKIYRIKNKYPKAQIIVEEDLMNIDKEFFSSYFSVAFDKSFYDAYSKYILGLLKNLDSYDTGGAILFENRMYYCIYYLLFWEKMICNYNPDVVVFQNIPIIPSHYSLYAACKVNKIKTIIGGNLHAPFFHLQFKGDIEDTYNEILSYYENNKYIPTSNTVKSYVANKLDSYKKAEPKGKADARKFSKELDKKFLFLRNPKKWLYLKFLVLTFFNNVLYYYKYPSLDSLQNIFHIPGSSPEFLKRKRDVLYQHYTSLCEEVNFKNKFIYIPLHLQPERSTFPEGGIYVFQHLIIDVLSKAAPKNWMIYIKEHPSVFTRIKKSQKTRSKIYYDIIKSYPNVELLKVESNQFDLIDNAKCIATVSGTGGWEALLRGKPVLYFGEALFRGCNGAFRVRSIEDAKVALEQIIMGIKVDTNEVVKFISAIEYFAMSNIRNVYPELIDKDLTKYDTRKLVSCDSIYNALTRFLSNVFPELLENPK